MAGSRSGGLKAAATNKEKYGEDFYRNIGHIGGANGSTGGFYGRPEVARKAGAKGGRSSSRGRSANYDAIYAQHRWDIHRMLQEGLPYAQIAREFGMDVGALRLRIRRNHEA